MNLLKALDCKLHGNAFNIFNVIQPGITSNDIVIAKLQRIVVVME